MSHTCRMLLAAVLLAASAAAAAAPAFDEQRLFTTAAERERLDELRARGGAEKGAGDAADAGASAEARARTAARREALEKSAPPPPDPVEVRGFVRRSDGPEAVWVNDGSTIDGRLPERLRIHEGRIDRNSVLITTPDGRTVRIRPGQVWDPETGRVVDRYRR